jgi:osmoprotectant transport system substrate-binding protein
MKYFTLLLILLSTACGGGERLVVGSKQFTESEIVGEMVAQLAEASGAQVDRKFYVGGTLCFQSVKEGSIDVYVEYTGTGLVSLLNEKNSGGPDKVYQRVASEFKKRWNITWAKPLGFNNTYAMVMPRALAEKKNITKISQLQGQNLRCGFDFEFYDRPDGYRGLKKLYGDFCADSRQMDPGLMYQAAGGGEVDVISGYATDGRIKSLNLVALEDDKNFFPPYFAAPILGPRALEKAPGLAAKLEALAGKISDSEMTSLNAAVDVDKHRVPDVVRKFLTEKDLL